MGDSSSPLLNRSHMKFFWNEDWSIEGRSENGINISAEGIPTRFFFFRQNRKRRCALSCTFRPAGSLVVCGNIYFEYGLEDCFRLLIPLWAKQSWSFGQS